MNIAVKNLQNKISIPHSKVYNAALKVCRSLGLNKSKSEISIVFVGSRRMRSLNQKFLGHDYVTDVITFDLTQGAEIIICPLVAKRHARMYQKTVAQEILLYVIHGLLHVAGFDDHTQQDIKKMRFKEQEMLKKIK